MMIPAGKIHCNFNKKRGRKKRGDGRSGTCEVDLVSLQVLPPVCKSEGLALDQPLDQQLLKRLPERKKSSQ